MTVWFLLIVMTMSNGEVKLVPTAPISPEYATQEYCMSKATEIFALNKAEDKPKNIKSVSPFCVPITEEQMDKALPPKA